VAAWGVVLARGGYVEQRGGPCCMLPATSRASRRRKWAPASLSMEVVYFKLLRLICRGFATSIFSHFWEPCCNRVVCCAARDTHT
jgi:hypothetical protein